MGMWTFINEISLMPCYWPIFLQTQFWSSCYSCKGSDLLTLLTFILTISEDISTPRPPSLSESLTRQHRERIIVFVASTLGNPGADEHSMLRWKRVKKNNINVDGITLKPTDEILKEADGDGRTILKSFTRYPIWKPYPLNIRMNSDLLVPRARRIREHSHRCLRCLRPLHNLPSSCCYWMSFPTPQLVSIRIYNVFSRNLRTITHYSSTLSALLTDGSLLPLSINEIGSTEIFATSLLHSKFDNDRFRVLVKDMCCFGD